MRFEIQRSEQGKLLRSYLRELGVSAALLSRLKRDPRGMLLNGTAVTVRATLCAGDVLELAIEEKEAPEHVLPRELPLDILLRDDDLTVCNKSAGMPTHPSHGHFEDTLANALAFRYSTPENPFRPRFVNRLDRNTTGLVLVANHALSAAVLSRSMAAGEIHKTYLALVHGAVRKACVIDRNIRRREESIIFREVCGAEDGERAITEVQPLYTNGSISLLRLIPRTGRTHQLRVHLASIDHPLLGDDLYGMADGFPRHALHAATLRFPIPRTGESCTVSAPLPQDMMGVIKELGEGVAELAALQTEQGA